MSVTLDLFIQDSLEGKNFKFQNSNLVFPGIKN